MKLFSAIKNKMAVAGAILCSGTLLLSCSKWDDYKQHIEGGEILYTGKLDSAKIFSGKERIQVYGLLNADPKITTLKVFWNNKNDSVVYEIKPSLIDTFRQYINIPEGIRPFTIHTYDAKGNKSVPVTVTGVSYGDAYRRKLTNRLIAGIEFEPGYSIITWEQLDPSIGPQFTEIQYTDSGMVKSVFIKPGETSIALPGMDTTTTIRYRTIYKPEPTSVDTFHVPYTERLVKIAPQLLNRKVPFITSGRSGRWGNLADWKSNDAVKSHGGYGGWDEWNGNIFNVESGWGAPAVTNGKIWQTRVLNPGTYTFAISDLRDTNLTEADNAYLVVSEGDGLPDVAQVQTAIGYTKIVNGKPLAQLKVTFTLTERKEVSIGYLTTQPAGDPGRFCNVRAFNFIEN
ncbi:DUF4998 domain-containing protein [Parasegetibacter sp. NRK P23]|uniref:DUF4998 domain-containing protein n=1 Tax=Parasegetibacter sp. NRK P23 TaxID=2942999 RepID=UPI00204467D4|nr:DUF4998 domain-containing protein [Parasegetibacter sp. NRK P23]MCM5528679.1 DUF5013 domain-containing protein [Parasegetibacter sp. NRK P23]